MNTIAVQKEEKLLDYLCNDLEDSPDTSVARAKQQEGLEVFKETRLLETAKHIREKDFKQFYKNSFSRCRSRFDEFSKVSLGARERR